MEEDASFHVEQVSFHDVEVHVKVPDPRRDGSLDVEDLSWQGEAPFRSNLNLGRALHDNRVYHHAQRLLVLPCGRVEHDEADVAADLRRSEANAFVRVHVVDHLFDEREQAGMIALDHLATRLFQARVGS